MAVAKSATSTGVLATTGGGAGTTITGASFGLTVGASDTFLLIATEIDGSTSTGITWDFGGTAQVMTQIGSTTTNATASPTINLTLWGLVNPTPGNKSLRVTSGANNSAYITGISFTGTVTTSVAAATQGFSGTTGNTTSAAATTTVAIPSGDLAFAFSDNINGYTNAFTIGTNPGDGGTSLGKNQAQTTNAAAEFYTGAGSTISCSMVGPTGQWAAAIVGIRAPGAAAGPSLGRTAQQIFRPGQGPRRGLSTRLSTFVPAAGTTASGAGASAGVGTAQATGQGIANSVAASAGVGAAAAAAATDVTDNFNRADGGIGTNWVNLPTYTPGGSSIVSSQYNFTTAAWDLWCWASSVNTFSNDQYSQVKYVGGTYVGVAVRCNPATGTGGYFWISHGDLYRVDGAGSFSFFNGGADWTAGDTARLEVVGSTITTRLNGVVQSTVTDSTYTSGQPGIGGFFSSGPVNLDDWLGGPITTGTTASGGGASAGVGTAQATGNALIPAQGASAGVGTVQAVGAALFSGVGATSGVGTVAGVGAGLDAAIAASAGVGTATGVGAALFSGVGSSAGTGTAQAVGGETADAVASSTGVGTAAGVGSSTTGADGVASSVGQATVAGVSAAPAASVAASAGTGAASGVGAELAAGVGASAGTGAAAAIGQSLAAGVGASAGVGTALGVGDSQAAGSAVAASAGLGAATGIGASLFAAIGNASGTAIVVGASPVTELPAGGAGHVMGGHRFTRKRWRELLELIAAEKAAAAKARKVGSPARAKALVEASRKAQDAIFALEDVNGRESYERDMERLRAHLATAAAAKKTADSIREAQAAAVLAAQLAAEAQDEQELMLLLDVAG